MTNDNDFLDDIEGSEETIEQETEIESRELAEQRAQAQAQKNLLARKRIDDLIERKRLKELLDDSADW